MNTLTSAASLIFIRDESESTTWPHHGGGHQPSGPLTTPYSSGCGHVTNCRRFEENSEAGPWYEVRLSHFTPSSSLIHWADPIPATAARMPLPDEHLGRATLLNTLAHTT